jgi:prepilin signal peptidase PulO-like enzyme (type II secretory pathway)
MLSLLFGLLGVPVGLALDALVERLAVPPGADEDAALDTEAAPAAGLHAEAGSLVVAASPGQEWLRRALIVGMTAALFATAGYRYDDPLQATIITAYCCVLLVCAATDALSFRVPNVVTYPAILGALLIGAVMPDANILSVLAGGALAGGILLVPSLLTGGVGMGMGDVKLATFVGLALGFELAVRAMLLMAFAGGIAAVFLLLSGLRKRGEPIPYAPFISAGALAVLLWQGAAFASLT